MALVVSASASKDYDGNLKEERRKLRTLNSAVAN